MWVLGIVGSTVLQPIRAKVLENEKNKEFRGTGELRQRGFFCFSAEGLPYETEDEHLKL